MTIHPVILCGGAGARLWPASRSARPKQFIDLAGDLSLFQDTVRRVAPLAEGGGRLVIVAGGGHRAFIAEQLAGLGVEATVLLEPASRDSAPAMAAAAAWIRRRDPDGVALFVASDHYIPDETGFRAAANQARAEADRGRIVTFGVRPTEPSSAYGYIRPLGPGLSRVDAFVEKPDRATAERYLAEGYLWNSGNFMVRADVLLGELTSFAPDVATAAEASLLDFDDTVTPQVIALGNAFHAAPRISIDYAVMERSDRVSVLPVEFRWSDLGAWDAVAAAGGGERGVWIGADGDACLVRAAEGMVVATAGVSNLAIIAEPDAVLVCSLDRAQEVKDLVGRIRETSPTHADGRTDRRQGAPRPEQVLGTWMRLGALPLWATLGAMDGGVFRPPLASSADAADLDLEHEAGLAWVFALAGRKGWRGPWRGRVGDTLARLHGAPSIGGAARAWMLLVAAEIAGEPGLREASETVWTRHEAVFLASRLPNAALEIRRELATCLACAHHREAEAWLERAATLAGRLRAMPGFDAATGLALWAAIEPSAVEAARRLFDEAVATAPLETATPEGVAAHGSRFISALALGLTDEAAGTMRRIRPHLRPHGLLVRRVTDGDVEDATSAASLLVLAEAWSRMEPDD